MSAILTDEFIRQLAPGTRATNPGSLFDLVTKRTLGVLVVKQGANESGLVKECFSANFPVSVEIEKFDSTNIPRIEMVGQTVVGADEILNFLTAQRKIVQTP